MISRRQESRAEQRSSPLVFFFFGRNISQLLFATCSTNVISLLFASLSCLVRMIHDVALLYMLVLARPANGQALWSGLAWRGPCLAQARRSQLPKICVVQPHACRGLVLPRLVHQSSLASMFQCSMSNVDQTRPNAHEADLACDNEPNTPDHSVLVGSTSLMAWRK